jgi:hypothetical protein
MNEWALYVVAGMLLLGAAALLLRRPASRTGVKGGVRDEPVEFFAIHCRYFPQVRHAFSPDDGEYLANRGSREVYKRWERSRRKAGRMYLAALREDFARLGRLSRALSLHSPQLKARREAEILWLDVRFQFLYGVVATRLLLGQSAADDLGNIASLIGAWGSRLEQAAMALTPPASAVSQ